MVADLLAAGERTFGFVQRGADGVVRALLPVGGAGGAGGGAVSVGGGENLVQLAELVIERLRRECGHRKANGDEAECFAHILYS